MRRAPRIPTAAAAALALLVGVGCGPRLHKEMVFETEGVRVQLRRTVDGGEPVPQGYDHPANIADVRIAHILASLTYETKDGEPRAAIRTSHVYPLAEGLAKALEQASEDDIVVAWTLSHDRRLGIFSQLRITAFELWVEGSQIYFGFYSLQEKLPREEGPDWEPPRNRPDSKPKWKIRPERAQARVDARSVAVDWRDDYYRQPLALRASGGRLKRRTIVMQDEELAAQQAESGAGDPAAQPLPTGITDLQIQALDELDGARRAGLISESEFQRRRRLILQGRLRDAGYDDGTEPLESETQSEEPPQSESE